MNPIMYVNRAAAPRRGNFFVSVRGKGNGISSSPTVCCHFPVLHHITSRLPSWYKISWAIALTFCWGLSIYQVSDRVQFYLSEPIRASVRVVRNYSISFPQLTVCTETWMSEHMHSLRKNISQQDEDPCEMQQLKTYEYLSQRNVMNYSAFIDSGHRHKQFTQDCVNQPYDQTTQVQGHFTHVFQQPVSSSKNNDIAMSPVHESEVLYYTGVCIITPLVNMFYTCTTVKIAYPAVKVNTRTRYRLRLRISKNCTQNVPRNFWALVHERLFEKSWIFWKIMKDEDVFVSEVERGKDDLVPLSITEFTYLNTLSNPCTDDETYIRCFQKFVDNCAKDAKVSCRLHEFGPRNLELCYTINDAVKAFSIISEQVKKTEDPCPRRCKETIYRRGLGRKEKLFDFSSAVGLTFLDNIVSVSEEYYAYGLVPLLSDIGGNIGLFLGVCVISAFEALEASVRRFAHK